MKNSEQVDMRNRESKKRGKRSKKVFHQLIFRDWCKCCGICSAFCPKNVIIRDENGNPRVVHPDSCIGCRFCELHCPDFAITIEANGTQEVG